MFEGHIISDNDERETCLFATYGEMLIWFAEWPEYGIMAWEDGEAIDQRQLQTDVSHYQG